MRFLQLQPVRLAFCFAGSITSRSMSKSAKREHEEQTGNQAKKLATGHWSSGLLSAMDDPNLRVFSDNQVIVIKDKYPKAEFHYLVLPKESIANLKVINEDHLELLQHMHDVGCKIASKKEHENRKFRLGYHAEPSMHHLHLHVISDDMRSDCMKTKKHYNSFVTDHFVDSKKIIESVKSAGKAVVPSSDECHKLLLRPLMCFKCGEEMSNMPKLKRHLSSHDEDL